jgi:hypothetical protein
MRRLRSSSINIRRVVFWVAAVCVFGSAAYGAPWDGSGTAEEPYLIYDANDMQAIGADSNYWGAHFKLMADINLGSFTGASFNIIGKMFYYDPDSGWVGNPFTGVFDGNGHSISNFSYNSFGTGHLGIFGYVDDHNAEIRDVGIVAADVNAGTGSPPDAGGCVGALVGHLEYGSITGCYVIDSKVCGGQGVGGLAGLNSFGEIQDCNSAGTIVIGYEEVGGLIGNTRGSILNCYSRDVSVSDVASGVEIGGLAGYNKGTISECYTRGSIVAGNISAGGLVGRNNEPGVISSCYSEDTTVAGTDYPGGLCGINDTGTISNCHSDCFVIGGGGLVSQGGGGLVGGGGSNISNCYSVSKCIDSERYVVEDEDCFWNDEITRVGLNIGTGLSTAEMMTAGPYVDSGWDFATPVWTIDEGKDYPRLWWEKTDSPGRYGGGRGLPAEPYLIYTAEEMQEIGANRIDWHKHFRLAADIDLGGYSGTEFNIIGKYIGTEDPCNLPFIGVFDGTRHTISNLTYSTDGNDVGIFAYVAWGAVIKDLGLINPNIDGGDRVGSLVARHYGTIINCYIEDGVVSGGTSVGGLVGSSLGEVSRCYSTASVIGEDCVGGLAGSTADPAPGMKPRGRGKIIDCYSRGEVSGDTGVGGLVGWNYVFLGGWGNYVPAKIKNCYAAGAVSGNSYVGGLIGNNNGDVNNCFWDVNSSGQSNSAGGTGKTTTEMQTESTFTDAGWDFVGEVINGPNDIWDICDGTNYPKLSWQIPLAGDFVCPDGVDFTDFAILANAWLSDPTQVNWNVRCDIAEPPDNVIDILDFEIFAQHWLEGL